MKLLGSLGVMMVLLTSGAMAENTYSNAPTYIPTNYRKRPVSKLPPVEVYRFGESAYQSLPDQIILAPQRHPVTGQKVVVPIPLSSLICRHAEACDIDPLLVQILTRHESGFSATAVSRAGARGLMQLMPETATSLGVTDIEDPEQNVSAGTRYLAEQIRRYGDLQLALAAYNAGPSSVESYGGIPPYAETRRYVASITAEYLRRRKKKG
jgi:hypothetical protein